MAKIDSERLEKLTIEEAIEVINFVRQRMGFAENDLRNEFLNVIIQEITDEEITPQEGITKARAVVDNDNLKHA